MKRITWTQLNLHASLCDIFTDKYSYSNAKEMHDTFYHFKAISYGRHSYLYGDCLILCLYCFYNLRETH